MSRTRGHTAHTNIAWLDDHRAPNIDDMFDRVTEEASRQVRAELQAARDRPGVSEGERRRLPRGESQGFGDNQNGA